MSEFVLYDCNCGLMSEFALYDCNCGLMSEFIYHQVQSITSFHNQGLQPLRRGGWTRLPDYLLALIPG